MIGCDDARDFALRREVLDRVSRLAAENDVCHARAPHHFHEDRFRAVSMTRETELSPKGHEVVNPLVNIPQKIREVLLGSRRSLRTSIVQLQTAAVGR